MSNWGIQVLDCVRTVPPTLSEACPSSTTPMAHTTDTAQAAHTPALSMGSDGARGRVQPIAVRASTLNQSTFPAARAGRERGAFSQPASSFFQQFGLHVAITVASLLDLHDDETVDEQDDDDSVFGREEHVGVAQDVVSGKQYVQID